MNHRPRRDHIRKPSRKDRLQEITDTMSHFSRVARKPVWFTYEQLWDIQSTSDSYTKGTRRMTTGQGFPSRQQFAFFVARHRQLKSKRVSVKINPMLPRNKENMRSEARYAYIHPLQRADEGVDYGGEE